MSSQRFRLREAGRIDRNAPLKFKFDGKIYEGFRGDTLASALLANGVHLVGRSFKYHRPRGHLGVGTVEANALIQVGDGNSTEPNVRASQVEIYDGLVASSQNRWPSLLFDLGIVNDLLGGLIPAGFYYKTFMWPRKWWIKYEYFIRRAAGLGKAPTGRDPDRYEKMHVHCDILIVGAGPAGLAAALAASKTGARVIIADDQETFGGSLNTNTDCYINDQTTVDWAKNVVATLESLPDVTMLPNTSVSGYYEQNYLTLLETIKPHFFKSTIQQTRHRLWKVRAKQVVLATGMIERPLVFANNDRPGIMLSSAIREYINK